MRSAASLPRACRAACRGRARRRGHTPVPRGAGGCDHSGLPRRGGRTAIPEVALRPIDALVVVPLALLGLLALARLARLRPSFRPLVGPFAACALAAVVMVFAGPPSGQSPVALLYLLPVLVLVVRATSLGFQWVFYRRQGAPPPSLLDSVVSVLLYGIGVGAIASQWFDVELTPFLATSAVVGAVVGLALQDTLGNLFAGIALHSEAPVHVGDWVRVGERDGRVEP